MDNNLVFGDYIMIDCDRCGDFEEFPSARVCPKCDAGICKRCDKQYKKYYDKRDSLDISELSLYLIRFLFNKNDLVS
jgi:NAD-dependent DNA ligase